MLSRCASLCFHSIKEAHVAVFATLLCVHVTGHTYLEHRSSTVPRQHGPAAAVRKSQRRLRRLQGRIVCSKLRGHPSNGMRTAFAWLTQVRVVRLHQLEKMYLFKFWNIIRIYVCVPLRPLMYMMSSECVSRGSSSDLCPAYTKLVTSKFVANDVEVCAIVTSGGFGDFLNISFYIFFLKQFLHALAIRQIPI